MEGTDSEALDDTFYTKEPKTNRLCAELGREVKMYLHWPVSLGGSLLVDSTMSTALHCWENLQPASDFLFSFTGIAFACTPSIQRVMNYRFIT